MYFSYLSLGFQKWSSCLIASVMLSCCLLPEKKKFPPEIQIYKEIQPIQHNLYLTRTTLCRVKEKYNLKRVACPNQQPTNSSHSLLSMQLF